MVYDDLDASKRSRNWNDIKDLGQGWRGPWACIRDFNDIRYQHEKAGGQPKDQRKMNKFNRLINDLDLIDLGFKGLKVT